MAVISSSSTLAQVIDTPNSAVRHITSATGQQVDSMSKGLGSHRWFGHLDDGPRPAQHCDHTPDTTHPKTGRAALCFNRPSACLEPSMLSTSIPIFFSNK